MKTKALIIQLNEINFDLVQCYLNNNIHLPNFSKLLSNYNHALTDSEEEYDKLEPWIQWVSFYTGLSYDQHRVYRLGDIINTNHSMIFSEYEKLGLKVGLVAPMNAKNDLIEPSYFIPDPWTKTLADTSSFSKRVSEMLVQTVNDNSSGKVSIKSFFTLLEICFKTLCFKDYFVLSVLSINAVKYKWNKALILDFIIHKLHLFLIKKKEPCLSSVFLNSGAHIQHHYMLNSLFNESDISNPSWYISKDQDPVLQMLLYYDKIIGDYFKLDIPLFIITGLSQIPYTENTIYWRLKDHELFFKSNDFEFKKINPRMTRDFEVLFDSNEQRDKFLIDLKNIKLKHNSIDIFGEIDIRDESLFVTLTYPNDINIDDIIVVKNNELPFKNYVNFVAVKNGKHYSKGHFFFPDGIDFKTKKDLNIKDLGSLIKSYLTTC